MPTTAQMPTPASIVPISSQGAVQPPDSAQQLMTVLQMFMDQNKPKANLSDATPDQAAAGQADAQTKADGKKAVMPAGGTVQAPKDASGTPQLPDLISQLFNKNAAKTDASKTAADPAEGNKKISDLTATGGFDKSHVGKAIDAVSSGFSFLSSLL